jgi:hypothetical protein
MKIMWYPGPRLNRIDRILTLTSCKTFLEAHLQRTLRLSVADREVFPDCAGVRIKCASVRLWGQSGCHRKLPGVTCPSPEWSGCYIWYHTRPLWLHGSGDQACGPWLVWSVVAHGMAHVPALDDRRFPIGEVPILGLIDGDVDLLMGMNVIS